MDICRLAGIINVGLRGPWVRIHQVVHDRGIKQYSVLGHDAYASSKTVELQISDVVAVDSDGALINVIEPEQEFEAGRFATARLAHDGGLCTGRDLEADSINGWILGLALIPELDVLELYFASRVRKLDGIGLLHDSRRLFELCLVSGVQLPIRDCYRGQLTRSSMRSASIKLFWSIV